MRLAVLIFLLALLAPALATQPRPGEWMDSPIGGCAYCQDAPVDWVESGWCDDCWTHLTGPEVQVF